MFKRKEKKKKKHLILKSFGIISALAGSACALVAFINKRALNKMEADSGQNNMMNSACFTNGKIDVKSNTDNVYANCVFGNMDINVPVLTEEVLCIDIFNMFGNININVADDINVVCAADNIAAAVNTDFVESNAEITPVIYVIGKNVFSNVKINKISSEEA